jgi:hypothetical protein
MEDILTMKYYLLLLILVLLIVPVSADYSAPPVGNVSFVQATLGTNYTQLVNQGDTIYWGRTYDLSLVEGWYGKVFLNDKIVDVSQFTQHIYIDPLVFPEGEWHQWAPYLEPSANTLAFFVSAQTPAENLTVPALNVSMENITHPSKLPPSYMLPNRHPADILVARYDGFCYNASWITNETTFWVFGNVSNPYGLYGSFGSDGWWCVNHSQISSFEPGPYDVMALQPGRTTAVLFDPNTSVITLASLKQWRNPTIDLTTLAGSVAEAKIRAWLFLYSDINVTNMSMLFEEPKIEITEAQDYMVNNTPTIRIAGYTNVANGSEVYALFDEEDVNPLNAFDYYVNTSSWVVGYEPGDYRQFNMYMPIDYNLTHQHRDKYGRVVNQITIHTVHNLWSTIPYWVYFIPTGQNATPMYNKYTGGNLWVPTPTPEIVNVTVTQIVEREVYVPVTPNDTQVYNQQVKAQNDLIAHYTSIGLVVIFCGAIGLYFLRLVYRAIKNRDWYKRREQ